MIERIIEILQEINKIKSKSEDLEKLSIRDKTKLEKLDKELEKIRIEYDQLKGERFHFDKEVFNLVQRNEELIKINKELTKSIQNTKTKPSYYELIKNFIITMISNLLSFALIKYILKRTVPLYLEKLVSYVIMGVIINNIFGYYLKFIYDILYELINQSSSAKVFLSFLGITSFGEWINMLIQHFKEFFTNLRKDSTGVNLEKFNKDNDTIFDKQLEIEKLKRTNEILANKLDELNSKVEEIINPPKEESRGWSEFLKDFSKDIGITAYNSIKFIVITGLVRYTIESLKNPELINQIKSLINKYFGSDSDSDSNTSDDSDSTSIYVNERRSRAINREINAINSEFVDKSTQTSNVETVKQTSEIEENDLSSSVETVKPSRKYQESSFQVDVLKTHPVIVSQDSSFQTESKTLDKSSQTISNTIDNQKSIQVNTVNNSNITSSIDNDQQYLAIESQRDQGYVKIDKYNSSLEKYLLSNEYNNKASQLNKNMVRVTSVTNILNEIHNELNTLDITKDFDRISYLQQEIVKLANEANHLKIESNKLGEELELEIKKHSN
jgi:FtsZ-binding cell division protein ZapB